jgi:sn-glycerol 3-phosphate transport system substrate-binding protein
LRRTIPLILATLVTLLVGARPEAAGPTKVAFWNYITFDQPTKELESLIKAFNGSQAKYVVENSSVGAYQDLNTKVVAALRAKNAPTLAMVDNVFFTKLVAGNQLAALNPLLDLTPALQADLEPVAWSYGSINNQRYGLPWATSTLLLYYNADALKARGIAPPKTWQEFSKSAKALTGRGTKGAIFIIDAWFFGSIVTGLGGNIFDANGVPDFDGPASLAGVKFLLDLQRSNALIVRSFSESQAGVTDFLRTKAFFAIAPSDSYTALKQYSGAFNLGAVTLPGRSVAGEAQLVVFKDADPEQQRGAVEFWKFLLKTENQERWAKASGYVPVRKSVVVNPDERGIVKEARAGLTNAFNFPQRGEMQEWRRIIEDALEQILKGGSDPLVALAEAQKKTVAVTK